MNWVDMLLMWLWQKHRVELEDGKRVAIRWSRKIPKKKRIALVGRIELEDA